MNDRLVLVIISLCYFIGGLTLLTFNVINFYYNTELPENIYRWYIFILVFVILSSLILITYMITTFSTMYLKNYFPFVILLVFYNILLIFGVSLISLNPLIIFYQLFYYLLLISCLINLLLSYQMISFIPNEAGNNIHMLPENFFIKSNIYRLVLILSCIIAFMYYPLYITSKYYTITDGFQNIKNYYI